MAIAAGSKHLRVVHVDGRFKERAAVAVFTGICRLNVLRTFAGRIKAVVAAKAVSDDVGVIEYRRYP